jgi:hypothetical protein
MNRLTIVTLLIVFITINIGTLVWIGYNVNPILTLILIIGEVWAVASIIKSEPKDNNQGKLRF